jgi:hypothetical protein
MPYRNQLSWQHFEIYLSLAVERSGPYRCQAVAGEIAPEVSKMLSCGYNTIDPVSLIYTKNSKTECLTSSGFEVLCLDHPLLRLFQVKSPHFNLTKLLAIS